MTPHNEANIEDVAKTVLMPGDPLRATYIANNYLDNPKLINSIRNMNAYTGFYKNKRVTVFPSGMGMPSMGIYAYELFKFYDVQNIIRIGSCGALSPDIKLLDTILVNKSYTPSNFAFALTGETNHIASGSDSLNNLIKDTASNLEYNIVEGNTLCSELFDHYCGSDALKTSLPKDLNLIASEMEAFALFSLAKFFGRTASCLLTVVDSHFTEQSITAKDRECSLKDMINLALESSLNLE